MRGKGEPVVEYNVVGERFAGALPVPATLGQEGLWLLDQLDPGSPQYAMVFAFRLGGALDVQALTRAVQDAVSRHGALRTTFVTRDGALLQAVADELVVPLPVEEVRGGERGLQARFVEEEEKGFDLERGPLVRATLLRLGADDHVLLLTVHHIVFDGQSVDVLLEDLRRLYAGELLKDEPAQYADFARAEQEWLATSSSEDGLEFWRRTLDGAGPPDLPTDRPRGSGSSIDGASVAAWIPKEDLRAIRELLAEERVTPFMFLHAVHHLALAQVTGSRDSVIGSPVSTRGQVGQGAVGYFVNMVPVRVDSTGLSTFRQLLREVRGVLLEAYEHQAVPFPWVAAALGPEGAELLRTVLSFEFRAAESDGWPGLDVTPVYTDSDTSKFDLTVAAVWGDAGCEIEITFRTALFDRRTVRGFGDVFTDLVSRVALDPDGLLSDLVPSARSVAAPARSPETSAVVASDAPGAAAIGSDSGPRVPRTARERALCELFAEVLGLEEVGTDESFFDLGGHSLLVGRLVSRMRAEMSADVAVQWVFEFPTVAGLAERIGGGGSDPLTPVLPLRPAGDLDPVFFLPPVGGLAWSYARFLPFIPEGHPVHGLQTTALGAAHARPQTLSEVAALFLRLIRETCPDRSFSVIGWSLGGVLAQEVAVLAEESGPPVRHVVLLDSVPAVDEVSGMDEELSAETFAAIRESISGSGASGFGRLTDSLFQDQTEIAEYCLRLLLEHRSRPWSGHIVSVETEDSGAERARAGVRWADLAGGGAEVVPLACLHEEVMEPAAVAAVGPVLTRVLAGTA